MPECLNYFKKILAEIHPTKLFQIPSWIPKLCNPQIQFDLDPPTYQQISVVIYLDLLGLTAKYCKSSNHQQTG
jgi:hypothetical protein